MLAGESKITYTQQDRLLHSSNQRDSKTRSDVESQEDGFNKFTDKSSINLGLLGHLDQFDKALSGQIHALTAPSVIEVLILLFGLLYNRWYCFISAFFSLALAAYYPQNVVARF